jgi:hypothetical protein
VLTSGRLESILAPDSKGRFCPIRIMTLSPIVLIVAADEVETLKTNPGGGTDLRVFADTDAIRALEAITREPPRVVVLGRAFVETEQGASLVSRIKANHTLADTQVRVLAEARDYPLLVSRRAGAGSALGAVREPPLPTDHPGTRRARRWRMQVEFEAHLDGNAATLVDLSRTGAQVLVSEAVRLGQRVSLLLVDEEQSLLMTASVVWAEYQLSPGAPHYRVGVQFIDADPEAVEVFCARHGR